MKKGEKQGFWGEKRRRCACKLLYNRMKAFRKIQNSLPEGHDSKPCRKGTLYCPKGLEGKGLERETLLPFPRLRRFGTHYETGSKFLLLFSIKSKGERLGFAEKVPNGRTHIFARRNLVATALNQCAALLLFSLAHAAFINPIGACTATFPHKKRPLSGLFPSTILHRQVHIRNMLPHGGIRRLIISALNRFDNLPMQLNRHINDSGVLRQRFTHCQTNPVFKGIL